MKYFTRQLWMDAQQPGDAGREAGRRYEEAFGAYARELEFLRDRLPPDVFDFFQNADVHDGALIHVHLRDAEGPVAVELSVAERSATIWTLRYTKVRRVLIDFPSEPMPFSSPANGFEDWGYHELSDAGDGFLRHEVLFSSGAIVLFEFREVSVSRS